MAAGRQAFHFHILLIKHYPYTYLGTKAARRAVYGPPEEEEEKIKFYGDIRVSAECKFYH
jgi:hypothetical protein